MSNNSFVSTPTKSKISTSVDSGGNNSANTSRHDMQDINYLLYLEALRRMKDDENNIHRQLEDKMHQIEQTKSEYALLYEKYVRLIKLAGMREMLETPSVISGLKLDECKENVENLLTKIKPDQIKTIVNEEELIACKVKLKEIPKYENVEKQYEKLTEHKKCVDDIRKKGSNLTAILLASTIENLDNFVEKFQIKKKD